MICRDIRRSQNGKQHESGAGTANKATANPRQRSVRAEQMKEQFPNYSELERTLENQADAEGKPPRFSADRRGNVHSVKCEFLDCFEDCVSKENREALIKA